MIQSNSSPVTANRTPAAEFDRQVATLLALGYPRLVGLGVKAFVARCEKLRARLSPAARGTADLAAGKLPFVLVVPGVPATTTMTRVERTGRSGVVSMRPVTPDDFAPIAAVRIPTDPVYLLLGFERGDEFRDVRPEDALRAMQAVRRSPLTIAEGIAVLTHHPDILIKNHCFSLLASRRNDQRVPALWLSEGRPKLGWCWDRNPHTWLGSASCSRRRSGDG